MWTPLSRKSCGGVVSRNLKKVLVVNLYIFLNYSLKFSQVFLCFFSLLCCMELNGLSNRLFKDLHSYKSVDLETHRVWIEWWVIYTVGLYNPPHSSQERVKVSSLGQLHREISDAINRANWISHPRTPLFIVIISVIWSLFLLTQYQNRNIIP